MNANDCPQAQIICLVDWLIVIYRYITVLYVEF